MNIGADGLKTGYTDDSGYGLVASAVRDGQRLIMVINGTKSEKERAEEARKLMDWGLRAFEKVQLFRQGEVIARCQRLRRRANRSVGLIGKGGVDVFLPRGSRDLIKGRIVYQGPVPAPVDGRPGDRQAADHARPRRAAQGAGLCRRRRRARHHPAARA